MATTDFVTHFYWQSLLAAGVAVLLFSLPGLIVLRWLGFSTRLGSALLAAPALGLCTYGSFSLALTSWVGYSPFTLLITWLLFQASLWLRPAPKTPENFCEPSNFHSLLLISGATGWAVMTTLPIVPAAYQGGLVVNAPIFDHAKVAIVDAIARQGLLPINPYYAPDGQTIPLIYYYTWHFLASQLKLLVGVTGWQAEVAMTWFTNYAVLTFLSALAIRLTQRTTAGMLLLVFAFAGAPVDLLAPILGPRLEKWFSIPPGHGLEVLWVQMEWVPQHVLSALAVVLLIFLSSRMLASNRFQIHYSIIAGLTTATAFGTSTWLGGIGLIMVLPIFFLTGGWLRLPQANYLSTLKAALFASFVTLITAIPLLISQASGPSLANSSLPFGLAVFPATRLFSLKPEIDNYLGHILLFWLQFLPLNLGISYVLGLLVLVARSSFRLEERVFQALSLGGSVGYLLVSQFVQSTLINNTFGWRAVLVPVMLLLVWSAVALTELASAQRPRTLFIRWQKAVLPMTVIGLTIGCLSTLWTWRLPSPHPRFPPPPELLAAYQGFFRQQAAWAKVREYAGPFDRVQANPDGYAILAACTLPYALFADRSTAYTSVEYTTAFAYRYDQTQNAQQYQLIQNIFSAHPRPESLRKLRDQLQVKVLLIDKFDAVWPTTVLEQSGIYRLVYREADFKILVATTKDNLVLRQLTYDRHCEAKSESCLPVLSSLSAISVCFRCRYDNIHAKSYPL